MTKSGSLVQPKISPGHNHRPKRHARQTFTMR